MKKYHYFVALASISLILFGVIMDALVLKDYLEYGWSVVVLWGYDFFHYQVMTHINDVIWIDNWTSIMMVTGLSIVVLDWVIVLGIMILKGEFCESFMSVWKKVKKTAKKILQFESDHVIEVIILIITVIVLACSGYLYYDLYEIVSHNPDLSNELYYRLNLFLVIFILIVPYILLIFRSKRKNDFGGRLYIMIYMALASYLFLMLKVIIPSYSLDGPSHLFLLLGEIVLLIMAIIAHIKRNKVLNIFFYVFVTAFNLFLAFLQLLLIGFRGGGPH